eukprot:GILK01012760.1.p1 GENE.GILK01012760.1~~GILK01012760.1.p1  ORF type:complete len:1512 (-),score=290.30 GILK01012760.1:79-4425(-)
MAPETKVNSTFSSVVPDHTEDWLPASMKDTYEWKGLLGKGGMGVVHEVYHRGWKRALAVKSPFTSRFRTESDKKAFKEEAEAWVKLGTYPHIVTAYMVRDVKDVPRVFAELVRHGDLKTWITSHKLYTGAKTEVTARIFDCAIQVAWGLAYAHSQGLVHQDMKPDNVMIDATVENEPLFKVTDFGLAATASATATSSTDSQTQQTASNLLTASADVEDVAPSSEASSTVVEQKDSVSSPQAPFVGGTKAYWSPEQAYCYQQLMAASQQGEDVYTQTLHTLPLMTHKADIYAYGVTMLEVLTGKRSWSNGENGSEALMGVLDTVDAATMPRIPEIEEIIRSCLCVEPSGRPDSMRIIADLMIQAYHKVIGEKYFRTCPTASADEVYSLNNRALSCYELNRLDESIRLWNHALKQDPNHLQTVYNSSVAGWLAGQLDPNTVLDNLKRLPETAEQKKLLSYAMARQGLVEQALSTLNQLKLESPDSVPLKEIDSALNQIAQVVHEYPVKRTIEHDDGCLRLCASEDGAYIVLLGRRDVAMFDTQQVDSDCLLFRQTNVHGGQSCYAAALFKDCSHLLTGGDDGVIHVWSLADRRCPSLVTSLSIEEQVYAIHLFENDSKFIVRDRKGKLSLWECKNWTLLQTLFRGFDDYIRGSSCLSPNQKTLFFGHSESYLAYDLTQSPVSQIFEVPPNGIHVCGSMVMSKDGNRLFAVRHSIVTVFDTSSIYSTNVQPMPVLYAFPVPGGTDTLILHSNEQVLFTRNFSERCFWDISDLSCVRAIAKIPKSVSYSTFCSTNDGRSLLSMQSKQIVIEPFLAGDCFQRLNRLCSPTEISDLSALLLSSSMHREKEFTSLIEQSKSYLDRLNDPTVKLNADESIRVDCIRKCDTVLTKARAVPGMEGRMDARELWTRLAQQSTLLKPKLSWLTLPFTAEGLEAFSITTNTDGSLLFSGGSNGIVHVFDNVNIGPKALICSKQLHQGGIKTILTNQKSTILVTGSTDATVEITSIQNLDPICSLIGHEKAITKILFTVDEKYLITSSADGTVRFWTVPDAPDNDNLSQADKYICTSSIDHLKTEKDILTMTVSSCGRYLITVSEAEVIRAWDLRDLPDALKLVRIFAGCRNVKSLFVTPDTKMLIAACADSRIRLFDLYGMSAEPCRIVKDGLSEPVNSISLTKDGQWLFAISGLFLSIYRTAHLDLIFTASYPIPLESISMLYDSIHCRASLAAYGKPSIINLNIDWILDPKPVQALAAELTDIPENIISVEAIKELNRKHNPFFGISIVGSIGDKTVTTVKPAEIAHDPTGESSIHKGPNSESSSVSEGPIRTTISIGTRLKTADPTPDLIHESMHDTTAAAPSSPVLKTVVGTAETVVITASIVGSDVEPIKAATQDPSDSTVASAFTVTGSATTSTADVVLSNSEPPRNSNHDGTDGQENPIGGERQPPKSKCCVVQ